MATGGDRYLATSGDFFMATDNHAHIAKTARFLGFLRGRCQLASTDPVTSVDDLKDIAGDLEFFDVYFRVHLGVGDSQEPLVKRLFWRLTTQNDFEKGADAALTRHGLSITQAAA
jgi:hypothetical protein